MLKIEKNKLYLVTGGSRFLGVPLCKRILEEGGIVSHLASAIRSFTIPLGTVSPFDINLYKLVPRLEPDITSCLSRSPELRCFSLYFNASFSHCVPRPLPGPP